jgi:hypothetical protein
VFRYWRLALPGDEVIYVAELLATAWGVRQHPDGKTVWCSPRLWRQPGPPPGSGVGE